MKLKEIKYQAFHNCPVCTWDYIDTVYSPDDSLVYTHTNTYKLKTSYKICPKCGYVFLNPVPSNIFLSDFYQNQYRVKKDDESKKRQSRKEEQFNHIWEYISDKGSSVFDIGAYDGHFLSFFKNKGWQVSGNELSIEGCRYAKNYFNIELYSSDIFGIKFDKKFDLISMIQVLEHITKPVQFLKRCSNMLNNNGHIYIEVPNLKYISSTNLSDYFNFQHVSYFEKKNIETTLNMSGFEIISSDISKRNKALNVIAKKIKTKIEPQICNAYEQNRTYINNYIKIRQEIENSIIKKISRLKKVVIYGAGQHTDFLFNLIKKTNSNIHILFLVDSDSSKHNKSMFGYKIHSPQHLTKENNLSIIISSFSFQDVIKERLLQLGITQDKVITLYD